MASTAPGTAARQTFWQLVRYGITGGLVTLGFSAGYWLLAEPGGMDPQIALTLMFVLFSIVGFVAHGAVSFRGHGGRDRATVRAARFMGVNLVGFVLNQGWVLLLVKQMGGPAWWPIVPFTVVTPLVTFYLHRRWVYS